MVDLLFDEVLKYFFLNTSVVLYIAVPAIFIVAVIATLRILVKWSDSY